VDKDLDLWQWYYSPELNSLLHYSNSDNIQVHPRQIPATNRNIFQGTSTHTSKLPKILLKASIRKNRAHHLWLIDIGVSEDATSIYSTFEDNIMESSTTNKWCYQFLNLPTDYAALLNDIKTVP
jgi:hypothetical protein